MGPQPPDDRSGPGGQPWLLGLFLGVTLWIRWPWLRADLPALVPGVIPDDAFYYFEIARRVFTDGGLTFDGTTPATGFHPLWLALVTPFFWRGAPGAVGPVQMTLWLGAVCSAVAALALASFARRVTGHAPLAVLLGLAFVANLWVVRESLNGLETALALAGAAVLLATAARYLEAPRTGTALTVGLVAGLSVLARSDMVLIVGPLALVGLLGSRRGLVPLTRAVTLLAGPPLVALLGLLGLNLALTGEPLQSSAQAIPWLVRANWNRLHRFAATPADAHRYGLEQFVGTFTTSRELLGEVATVALLAGVGAVLIGLVARRGRLGRPPLTGALVVLALVVGLIGLQFVHGYLRWFPRSWYFVGWGLASYAAAAVGAAALRELGARAGSPARWRQAVSWGLVVALLVVLALELARTRRELPRPRYAWQSELLEAGRGIAEAVPAGEAIGSFNAGIIGYTSGRTVVNLDGVVNGVAGASLRQGRLGDYLRSRGIDYLVDYPATWGYAVFRYAVGPFMGEEFAAAPREIVARFDLPGMGWPDATDGVMLLRIDWEGGGRAGTR